MTDKEMVIYILNKIKAEYTLYNDLISLKQADKGQYFMGVASTQFFFDKEENITCLSIEE